MQTPLKGRRGSQHGITLIELLVAMIIMTVISTMLVGGWISLQRSYAFARAANTARGTARDALDRMASDLRASQPPTNVVGATQFYFAGTSPYVCDAYHCVFYSAYNNFPAAYGDAFGQVALTAIWLDTSGTTAQKTLYWQRDTASPIGTLTSADRKIVLAQNVVNTSLSPARPIFTYYFRDSTTGVYSHSPATSLTSSSVANLRSVQIELVVDANLSHTPTYVDLKTTVRPRNATATN
ncbi:MAG TPA: prepilin-type N-terminal cleavage/methylation domain-containing protein [Candidatus Limnocylindrales bacterium]